MSDFDNLEINEDEILTAEELQPEPVPEAEEVPAEPEEILPEDPAADDTPDPEDVLMTALSAASSRIDELTAQLSELGARLTKIEAQEAARAKKLTGFFAPVKKDSGNAGGDPLPRIDREYTF